MADIKITPGELNDPAVDEIINLEKSLARATGKFVDDIPTPLYLNPIFYYAVAALVAGLMAWGVEEPFYSDDPRKGTHIPFLSDYVFFGPVAALIGLAVGLAYGISNRNVKQMFYCGVVGVGVGLLATLLTTFVADMVYGITSTTAQGFMTRDQVGPDGMLHLRGFAFFVQMCGRGVAWSIVSLGGGLGLGVALKSRQLFLNGIAGSMIGGLLGGLMFDPVHRFILNWGPEASLSRAIGIAAIGLLVGIFIGLFENISKEAWFQMLRGALAGKQFILFKSPMMIGSAPKCDIYLFKDSAIEPRHASVAKRGGKYLIQDQGTPGGTFVNGRKVDRHILQPNDIVSIGETVLKYHERQKR